MGYARPSKPWAGGWNGSIMMGMFVCLCLVSKKPSEWEFFDPAGTDLGVKLLTILYRKTINHKFWWRKVHYYKIEWYSINRKGDCSKEKVMVATQVCVEGSYMFTAGELEMFTGKVEWVVAAKT